jgi:hypothetical protein
VWTQIFLQEDQKVRRESGLGAEPSRRSRRSVKVLERLAMAQRKCRPRVAPIKPSVLLIFL